MRVSGTPFSNDGQLEAIDAMIRDDPEQLSLRFGRACCLDDLGRPDEALLAYVEVLQRDATHFGALTNLGSMLFERGRNAEAKAYFDAAVTLYPNDPMAHVNAAHVRASGGEPGDAERHYTTALELKPGYLHAHLGLARLYESLDDPARMQAQLDVAYARPLVWSFPYRGTAPPLQILLLASPLGGDVVTNLFFDDRTMVKAVMMPESFRDGMVLPPHQLLFNGIGDADRCRRSLERAGAVAAHSQAPLLNDPATVLATGRADVMRRLRGLPGVVAPRTVLFAKEALVPELLAARGFSFPLLLRSPGHHAGDHFQRVVAPGDLPGAVAELPGRELFAIEELDARGADGNVRKYRVVFVDRRLYPVHLAVAPHWKVHYFSADMTENAAYRAEEAAFLENMPAALGVRAVRALEAICTTIGLDYGGVDFGLDLAGNVLVFEANATMAVYPPGAGDGRWAYRRGPAESVVAAVREMLYSRAGRSVER